MPCSVVCLNALQVGDLGPCVTITSPLLFSEHQPFANSHITMTNIYQPRRRARVEPPILPALFVSNLVNNITEEDLSQFMQHEGVPAHSIKRITLETSTTHSHARYALVLFDDEQEVRRAAALLSGRNFRGQRLRAQPSFDKDMMSPSGKRSRHEPEPPPYADAAAWGPKSFDPPSEAVSTVKHAPTLESSGALAKAARMTETGVEVVYEEPLDSCLPTMPDEWRLYLFRGDELLTDEGQGGILYVGSRKYLLMGRDCSVVHVPLNNPSCSKQHAVLQFRRQNATEQGYVVPYLFDLDSTNGSYLNGQRVPGRTYIGLRSKDVLRFGHSSREYVLIHEEL